MGEGWLRVRWVFDTAGRQEHGDSREAGYVVEDAGHVVGHAADTEVRKTDWL